MRDYMLELDEDSIKLWSLQGHPIKLKRYREDQNDFNAKG